MLKLYILKNLKEILYLFIDSYIDLTIVFLYIFEKKQTITKHNLIFIKMKFILILFFILNLIILNVNGGNSQPGCCENIHYQFGSCCCYNKNGAEILVGNGIGCYSTGSCGWRGWKC